MNAPETKPAKPSSSPATAIGILGMHRSGTSSITRVINLLGIYLGADAKISGCGQDNLLGFWEHGEICDVQSRLLTRLGRTWDTVAPLPEQWEQSATVRPFREELITVLKSDFAGHAQWAWKDPRTCLLLPLWRDVLRQLETNLVCVFVVRNPVEVAASMNRRDAVAFNKAMGVWFHYNLAALRDSAGLPTAFLSYENFLANWENELRRCAGILQLDWPADEARLRATMNTFIQPELRHNQSSPDLLQPLPPPVRELYELLIAASARAAGRDENFERTVARLAGDFKAYAAFFENDLDASPPGRLKRFWRRWQKSFRKRFPAADASKSNRQK